jgi:hypothetical protein
MTDGVGSVPVEGMSTQQLQCLFSAVVAEYSTRLQSAVGAGEDPFPPLQPDGGATATDIIVTVRNMLKVFEIAPFELSMLSF